MNVLKFYFYRHGATKGNEERRYVGRTDEDITKNSEEYLKTIETVDADVVFSSPLKRCVHTAEVLFPENKIIIKNIFCNIPRVITLINAPINSKFEISGFNPILLFIVFKIVTKLLIVIKIKIAEMFLYLANIDN